MKKLYLVRHAESEGNIGTTQQGPSTPLSEQGIEQTKSIAQRFEKISVDIILSSPQIRAKHTAEAIAAAVEKEIEFTDLLVERKKPSAIIGLDRTSPEFDTIEDTVRENFHNTEWRHSDEENFVDLKLRAATLLNKAANMHEDKIVMVSHGVFMTMIFAYVIFGEALTSQEFWSLFVGIEHKNTGITVLKQSKFKDEPTRWKLVTWNDHAHLE